jgi:ribosomal protein S18 acetylase RimI-like enzyme
MIAINSSRDFSSISGLVTSGIMLVITPFFYKSRDLLQTKKVSQLIGQCYQDLQPTVESVMSWVKHPTFDPALWVWVIDNSKEIPIGLGIAEIDNNVLEGSLEWIQILPNYRGMGIGKCIVQELLSRLEKRVNFTTVSGEVNNSTNPETLYRSCRFKGSDIWWMFST